MKPLQDLLLGHGTYFSNWSWRPSKLFDGNKSANLSLTIVISTNGTANYSSFYKRWNAEVRPYIFNYLYYTSVPVNKSNTIIPKIGASIENRIFEKTFDLHKIGEYVMNTNTQYKVYYKRTGGLYWKIFTDFQPTLFLNGVETTSSKEETISFENELKEYASICLWWSDLYWWWYQINSDVRNNNPSDLLSLPIVKEIFNERAFKEIGKKLMNDLKENSVWSERKFQGNTSRYKSFIPKFSKPIIDEIDKLLAKHYGFTEEELDFIINYDIKYRMGDELNKDEE